MLKPGAEAFLQFPSETADRILHRGQIIMQCNEVFAAVFDEPDLAPDLGQEVLIYAMPDHEFMQQSARIVDPPVENTPETGAGEPPAGDGGAASHGSPPVHLVTVGDPVSAESRQCYRVVAIMTDRTAKLNDEEDCKLLDVSATGLALISTGSYRIGDLVTTTLNDKKMKFTGQVSVKSIKPLEDGYTRYGLHCAEDGRSSGDLDKGIQKISTAIQREQLRRLNRAA